MMSSGPPPVVAPVVMPYAAKVGHCPLCGRLNLKNPKLLNGVQVCRNCLHAFANRRQLAWLIDWCIYFTACFATGLLLGFLASTIQPATIGQVGGGSTSAFFDCAGMLVGNALWVVFILKDGFSGKSPGKMVCGVRVVDATTHEPISFWRSFKRNLPTFIPFVPFVLAFTLVKGWRWGDKWANTLVVWDKYRHRLPFDQRGLFCGQCGYDLTGNESGRCPECGFDIPRQAEVFAVAPKFDYARGPQSSPVEPGTPRE